MGPSLAQPKGATRVQPPVGPPPTEEAVEVGCIVARAVVEVGDLDNLGLESTFFSHCVFQLAWECLGAPPDELGEVSRAWYVLVCLGVSALTEDEWIFLVIAL